MTLLEANQITFYIKDRLLLDIDKLTIRKNDIIGLIGRNGSGKTTLLEVLAGKRTPENGTIKANATVELLPQLKRMDSTKSGGEMTQEYINVYLAKNPEILLADEPTTNLDTHHVEWLEKKLHHYQGAIVIISHDRAFLDALCTSIWEIKDTKIKEYKGNYSAYVAQKELEFATHVAEYEKYEQKKKQLEEAIILKEKKAERATKKPKNISSIEAGKSKPYFAKKQKKLQKSAKTLETRLEKLKKVENIKELPKIKMDFPNQESLSGRVVIRFEQVDGKVAREKLWSVERLIVRGGDKLAITGPNGSGKTTLVKKIIAGEKGITIAKSVRIGYFSQTIDILNQEKSILDNVKETSQQEESVIRTVLARLHFFKDDVYKPISVLSGGERVKVALAKLLVSDINTFILDEPTNYLDIESVEALESLFREYKGTIIFVSHDRRFVENIANRIVEIKNKQIQLFEGNYLEYKNDTASKKFDATKEKMLLLETKITEVLSRLSILPTPELELEFQKLLAEKRKLSQ